MDIHNFRKRLDRYRRKKANETENALVEAWYKSYNSREPEVDETEIKRTRLTAWEKINAATNDKKIRPLRLWYVAAAIALLAVGSVTVWKLTLNKPASSAYLTVNTGINSVKQITLPDGTTVWLNSATTLQVPQNFDGGTRNIILKEGEAFFDVKHDAHRPFLVQTPALTVQVLGTSFNIQSIKSLNRVKVGVATGKVGLTRNGKTLAMLTPGQAMIFDEQQNDFKIQPINTEQLTGWKDGSTYLTNADFAEVALAIKNNYNITLKAAGGKIGGYRYTLILKHDVPLNQALKLITQMHNTHFKKEGDEVLIY